MPDYKAPVRDIQFVVNEVLESEKVYQSLPGYEEATEDLMNAIIDEGARFAENVLAPLNRIGDEQGCQWNSECVTTPAGYKEAYRQYVDNGWPALSADPLVWLIPLAPLVAAWAIGGVMARRIGWPIHRFLLMPVGLVILGFALANGIWKSWRRGGIDWRGTTYTLAELRAGQRVKL